MAVIDAILITSHGGIFGVKLDGDKHFILLKLYHGVRPTDGINMATQKGKRVRITFGDKIIKVNSQDELKQIVDELIVGLKI